MRRHGVFFILAGLMVLASCGCGMKARLYAVDRPRVDQATMGNAGYVAGEKKGAENIADRDTRRIYIFEFDKKKKLEEEQNAKKVDVSSSQPEPVTPAKPVVTPTKDAITLPYIGDDEPSAQSDTTPVNTIGQKGELYTVLKDDTLQKISKKVYGVFGKWTKIYDANKDKIKNPNFVKPGTVLDIPPVD